MSRQITARAVASRPPRVRRVPLLLAAFGLGVGAAILFSLGHVVTAIDPLQPSDAVYVLGGSRVNRTFEAARLYREGLAKQILLSPGGHEFSETVLEREGIHVPNDADIAQSVLRQLHIPADAITILPVSVDNTAQEADAILPIAAAGHWHRLIIITDRGTSRRAGYAFRRVFGDKLQVLVTCNRDDPFDPNRWWTRRWTFRSTFYEAPKLAAYWLGLRG